MTSSDWEGCADFVRLAREELGDARIVPTSRLDLADLKREDGIILLHPEKTLDSGSLARFMKSGGRVILLDDFGSGDGLLEHFGMERVPAPAHPAEALRNNPQLAIASPAGPHPVVADVTRVVTNHATGLKHPDLSPVLKIRGNGEPDVLVAVAGAVGQGRLLAVGDPSIVINAMLRYPGNKAFARAIVRYAGDDDVWGKRNGRVFIVNGNFEQKGAFGEESALDTEWNERLRAFADAIASTRSEGVSAAFAYFMAVAVTTGLLMWIVTIAGKTHRPVTPRFTRSIPISAQGGIAGHAAVIAGERTSRALAMLEWKSALEEELCGLLGLDAPPAHDVLASQVAAAGLLDTQGLHALRQLLLRMASIETLVLSRRPGAMRKVADIEVVVTARTIRDLLQRARARSGRVG
ncbi:MAG: DUF4350 domain-containing protein [Polyangiaceae bacterium]